jgi:hypothetical protein
LAILCFPWMFFRESDVRKMNALTDGFLEDICRQADAHKELLANRNHNSFHFYSFRVLF